MCRPSDRGQTLTELALVLPVFCLGVFTAVQTCRYGINMLESQRMAQLSVKRLTAEDFPDSRGYYLFHSLRGVVSAPQTRFHRKVPSPWRAHHGIATIETRGWIARAEIRSSLLPSGRWTRRMPLATQSADARTFLEPEVPLEN